MIQVVGTSSIFRSKFHEIICFPDWDDENGLHKSEYETKPILHFLWRNDNYWIYHKNTLDDFSQDDDPANKLWHIVKYYNNEDLQEEGIQLKQGDVIKLGRIRFKVKEIHKGIFQLKNNFDEGSQLNFVSTDGRSNNKIQIGVPQINNYIKQSTLIKQSETASAK